MKNARSVVNLRVLYRKLMERALPALVMAAALASAAQAQPARAPYLTLSGALTSAAHQTYVGIPFKVPPGTERLTVEFEYTGKAQK